MRWASLGAVVATVVWAIASVGFSFYVSHFGSYNKTYGTLAALIILMMWLYISAYVVLLGAEINAEAERQTVRDTTKGPPQPMGERGGYAADTVASAAETPGAKPKDGSATPYPQETTAGARTGSERSSWRRPRSG
jgi:membrane protein